LILLRRLAGIFLILLGILGIFLPVLQGIPLIFLGIYYISPRLAEYLKRKTLVKFKTLRILFFEEWKKTGVRAAITTRHCPVHFSKTNDMDDPDKRRLFLDWIITDKHSKARGLNTYDKFAYVHQVHGDRVAVVESMPDFKDGNFVPFEATDAIVTNVRGLNLLVMSADCLSVYLRAGSWIGLVHAGWRGAQAQIAVKTARILLEKSGVSPERVQVILGPAICGRHYEVGEEFTRIFPQATKKRGEKFYFDLVAENKRQLIAAGLLKKNIIVSDLCTIKAAKNLYSFRREGAAAGRMVSILVKD
jgi:YfiH family protein